MQYPTTATTTIPITTSLQTPITNKPLQPPQTTLLLNFVVVVSILERVVIVIVVGVI
jgi:hypothetical protein